jgi:FkbM family methyltransferase
VISFEPSTTVLPYLMRTHQESANKSRWTIFNTALGDFTGNILFEKNQNIDSAFDNILQDDADKTTKDIELVKITTIDEIVKIQEKEFAGIVIKIDVEGFEFNVLKGGLKFIEKHKPIIVLEIVNEYLEKYKVPVQIFMELINNMNYNIYGLTTLNKITDVHEFELSMMKNLNFALLPRD